MHFGTESPIRNRDLRGNFFREWFQVKESLIFPSIDPTPVLFGPGSGVISGPKLALYPSHVATVQVDAVI